MQKFATGPFRHFRPYQRPRTADLRPRSGGDQDRGVARGNAAQIDLFCQKVTSSSWGARVAQQRIAV